MPDTCKSCTFAQNEKAASDLSGKRFYDCFGVPPMPIVVPAQDNLGRPAAQLQFIRPVVDNDTPVCAHFLDRRGSFLGGFPTHLPEDVKKELDAPLDGGKIVVSGEKQ